MFTSARALLALKEMDSKKHSGVIALFNQYIIKAGFFPKELSKYLPKAKDIREDSDYGGVVYGQELEKAEKSAEETARLYQIPGGVRLKQLLFAIHTFYAFLMKLISIELVSLQDRSTVKSFVTQITYE